MSYDAQLAGMGRDELIAEIRFLTEDNQRLRRERDAYLDNLTHTQERCTELLVEVRYYRRVGSDVEEETLP
jgi:hypothetical protein